MRILVIGGTLFIGRRLVERLIADGHQVTVLHRNSATPLAPGTASLIADRNDPDAVRGALAGHVFDAVFDNVYDWQRGTTADQVAAAANAVAHPALERYVFMSSVGAYQEGLDLSEHAPLAEASDRSYAANKASSERRLFAMHRESGFPAVTLRPPFIYGPENPFYREAYFWQRAHDGRPMLVPGDGSRLMQFLHVDDLVALCVAILQERRSVGHAFNAGNPQSVTQNEAIREIVFASGSDACMVHVPREAANPSEYFAELFDLPPITMNVDKAESLLGFTPRPFTQGLRDTHLWWKANNRFPAPDYRNEDRILAAIQK